MNAISKLKTGSNGLLLITEIENTRNRTLLSICVARMSQ